MQLRPYQRAAHDAVVEHLKKCDRPVIVDAATGAGKSYIIAALARTLYDLGGGKRVLCLAPSKELVEQNYQKYLLTGEPASIFCASAGSKCLAHPVVFGSPMSVLNSIQAFAEQRFSLIVIDESHGLSPTICTIVDKLRAGNEYLRVVGLTATPYRLGSGYIYRQEAGGSVYPEEIAKKPWFDTCVFRIHAQELIDQGFLTQPVTEPPDLEYDTAGLELNKMHRYDAESVKQTFEGKRLTGEIMAEVTRLAHERQGALIFASTVQHAHECLECLPQGQSAIVTGKTPRKERSELLRRFKARELKYLVNVSVLTTGFDAPHVDLIAILRATESVGLLQQIVGRGLRADPGKRDCLILDYAGNIARHCPDGDIFNPQIVAHKDAGRDLIAVKCGFGHENLSAISQDGKRHGIDELGYCTDLRGTRVSDALGNPIPGHHGRRCAHVDVRGRQCGFRWVSKKCKECGAENDIAARYCESCKAELVDPNAKLNLENTKLPPRKWKTEDVVGMKPRKITALDGTKHFLVDFATPTRSFTVFLFPNSKWEEPRKQYHEFMARYFMSGNDPRTVTYKMNSKGYYKLKL